MKNKIDLIDKIDKKIAKLEDEIRQTPYHKGTEHHLGRLKAKIARLKEQEEKIKKAGGGFGFIPKKEGDATVVLIGPPSVGKSTLLNKLTQAHARVESWPFTTVKVIPGMMDYQGAKIQIFDLPGIITGAASGVGRGREILSATRSADLLIVMVDIQTRNKIEPIFAELKQVGVDLPTLTVVNKIDLLEENSFSGEEVFISAEKEIGLANLKKKIWEKLKLIRIYLKRKGDKPDFSSPLILKEGQEVKEAVRKIFPHDYEIKKILLWGHSALFPGQQVSLNHRLKDEDILSFDLIKTNIK